MHYHRTFNTKCLILIPTRELAVQIHTVFYKLIGNDDKKIFLDAGLAIGGIDIAQNTNMVQRQPEIIIGTPGRIVDLMKNTNYLDLSIIEIIIIDEADRLFQMGFQTELKSILDALNDKHQTMMFSATLSKDIKDLARAKMQPSTTYIDLSGFNIIPDRITQ